MIITYESSRLDGTQFCHLPEDQRPCSHFVTAVDEQGNVHRFIVKGEHVQAEGWCGSTSYDGNEYGPWPFLRRNQKPVIKHQNIYWMWGMFPEGMKDDAAAILDAIKRVTAAPTHFRRNEIVTITI